MTPGGPYKTDADAASTGSLLRIATHGVTPPSESYINGNAALNIAIWNSFVNAVVVITAIILLPDGSISTNVWQFNSTSDRNRNAFNQSLTEGFLLALTAQGPTQNGVANRCYISVKLQTAPMLGNTGLVMVQGYTSRQITLTWPPGSQYSSTDGAGALISITGTTPGAGAEISETVPTNAAWRLKTFICKLTASAAVATRVVHIIIDDGTNVLFNVTSPSGVTAGNSLTCVFGDDTISSATSDGVCVIQFPANVRISAGFRVRTLTTAIQAGDQFTAPQYLVEEYLVQ